MKKIFLSSLIAVSFFSCAKKTNSTSSTNKEELQTQKSEQKSESSSSTDEESKTQASDSDSDSPVVLDIFQGKVEFHKQFLDLVKIYEKEHPNVKIKFQSIGGGQPYWPQLKSRISSGDEPTIFCIEGPEHYKLYKDYILDISDQGWQDIAEDGTLDGITYDDKIYGIPYDREGLGLIYNKLIFEKAGIDPKSITSFDALKKASEKLDSMKDDLGIDAVYAFPGKLKWNFGQHIADSAIGQEFGTPKKAFEAKTLNFKYADGYKQLIDLEVQYAYEKENITSIDYSTQVEELFSLQKVAMMPNGDWVYNAIESVDPDFVKNVGLLPNPIPGAKEDSISVGVSFYWVFDKNKPKREIEEAEKFMKWVYTSDTGKEHVVNSFHFIPPVKGYDDYLDNLNGIQKDILDFTKRGAVTHWTFSGWPAGWSTIAFGGIMQEYISGKLPWEEALKQGKDAWAKLRAK